MNLVECISENNSSLCVTDSWACTGHPLCVQFDTNACVINGESGTLDGPTNFKCNFTKLPYPECAPTPTKCSDTTDCLEEEEYCFGRLHTHLCTHTHTHTSLHSLLISLNTANNFNQN